MSDMMTALLAPSMQSGLPGASMKAGVSDAEPTVADTPFMALLVSKMATPGTKGDGVNAEALLAPEIVGDQADTALAPDLMPLSAAPGGLDPAMLAVLQQGQSVFMTSEVLPSGAVGAGVAAALTPGSGELNAISLLRQASTGQVRGDGLVDAEASDASADPTKVDMLTRGAAKFSKSAAVSAGVNAVLPHERPAFLADNAPNDAISSLNGLMLSGQGAAPALGEGASQLQRLAAEVPLLNGGAVSSSSPTQLGQIAASNGLLRVVAETPTRPIQLTIDATLRSPQFAQELGDRVVWMAGRHGQVAEIALNPAHLGPLEVKISMSGNEAGAQFFSPHQQVRDALDAALPRLREMLANAGVALGQANVQDQALSRQSDSPQSQQTASGVSSEFESESLGAEGARARFVRSGLGLVDLYV